MIGQTILHYRIVEKLGEGGMGVVYKAEDTKLHRNVALKFLPPHIVAKEVDRSRFLQEAQSAAVLNHPNICTIYGIHDEGEKPFIEMEFVDGKTLRELDLVNAKPETSLGYALQIGEALQEAHSRGIVHRDIKADNIMVNAKGQVKVMDFGLAKIKGALKITKSSSTLGTLGYMAPEQIQGGQVDARSDIFAFGVVVFEMLTSRLPFRGEHEAAMMYSILNEQPELLAKYRSDTPDDLQRIISRALEKEPEDRYQSAADMVSELRRLQKKTTKVTRRITTEIPVQEDQSAGAMSSPRTGPIGIAKSSRRPLWIGIGILVLVAVVAAVLVFTGKQTASLNPTMSYHALQVPFSQIGSPSLSRDGNWVIFPAIDPRGKWDLYFMNSSGGEARRLTADSTSGMLCVDISPDGSRVVYDRYDPSGMKFQVSGVSSIGGASALITDVGAYPRWRPDGQRIGYARWHNNGSTSNHLEFWIVRPDGSDNHREFVDTVGVPDMAGSFAWSPDGNVLAYARSYPGRHQELVTYDLSSRTFRELTSNRKNIGDIEWTQRGTIIYSTNVSGNSNLWMIAASGGQPVQITKGSGPDLSPRVSGDGERLLYFQPQALGHIWSAKTDGSEVRQLTFDDINPTYLALSHDGNRIAFIASLPDPLKPGLPMFIMDREGNNKIQLVSSDFACHDPIWNPDCRTLLYAAHAASEVHDSVRTYLVDPASPGSTRFLTNGEPFFWVDEKTFVCYWKNASWLVSLDGLTPQKFFEDSTVAMPILNGKYVLYIDTRVNREGVWIASAPGSKSLPVAAPKKVFTISVPWATEYSGRYIYYTKNPGELRRLSLPDGKDERLPGTYPGLNQQSVLDVAREGKEIAFTDTRLNSKLVRIDNLFK